MANEKRLIDANALWDRIKNSKVSSATQLTAMAFIDTAPTVDAVEVKHGRWEYNPPTITLNASWQCSACRKVYWEHILETRYFDYCPNCGAKMDGDGNG
jgi:DNA-directed RNA polymerase subunit RPC12/RpoP